MRCDRCNARIFVWENKPCNRCNFPHADKRTSDQIKQDAGRMWHYTDCLLGHMTGDEDFTDEEQTKC